MRKFTALFACLTLCLGVALAAPQQADQDRLAGNWKVSILIADADVLLNYWLVKLETKDGKVIGKVDSAPDAPPAAFKDLAVKNNTVSLNLELNGLPAQFALQLPKGENKQLRGTMTIQSQVYPVELTSTKDDSAKDFKAQTKVEIPKGDFKELKAEVAKSGDNLAVFSLARAMIKAAIKDKAPAADVQAALAPVLQAAGHYGEWRTETILKLARDFAGQQTYAGLGEDFARQALTAFGPKADTATQLRCLDLVAISLQKQEKKVEFTKLRGQIDELELKGHQENEKVGLGFEPRKADVRKDKRVVLVELFTGAQCPPCVAADLAFEGLAKTYPHSDVVLLQYHLHIPGPDPMTTPDTIARQNYYGNDVRGTPSIFFNGKSTAGGGGPKAGAERKYMEYRGVIDPLLKNDNKIALTLDAKRTGDSIAITAAAEGHKEGEKMKLRLALIEPWVRYAGSNGLSYHAHVVRALPGGPEGFTLSKATAKETAKVDLAELRQTADKHLQTFSNLDGVRPFNYRGLHVVAFVQDDDTKEVLHAIEVPVK